MQKTPPKFVPTLTHVVLPSADMAQTVPDALSATPVAKEPGVMTDAISAQIQQRVLQNVTERVMHQIETTLERHIREAVAGVALAHARAISQDLAPAIESVVTDTIHQALQDALAKELTDKSGYM
jgi:hypothetical protein